jgi:DedD protein
MPEQDFREIQLSGKQVVFLFMAFLVVGVVVFLLGVSVGRGVTTPPPAPAAVATESSTDAPATLPPPTQPAPGELTYTADLKRGAEPSRGGTAAAPATANEPPPTVAEQPATKPAPPPAAPAAKTSAPTTPAAKPQATSAKPAPVTGGWSVQVNAFSSKPNADRQAAQLKAKGYAAFVFTAASGGARYRVRVGPFADRSEADRVAARLVKEGLASKPSVIR